MVSFKKHDDIARFFGVLKYLGWDEKEKAMKELRRSFVKRLRELRVFWKKE